MRHLKLLQQSIDRLLQKSLVQDSIWMLASQGLGIITQATYFILVARALDTTAYGGFISVAAIASIVFPFVGLGSSNILVKNVSKSPETFRAQWGNTLAIALFTSGLMILIILASSSVLFSVTVPIAAIALILVADLIGLRLLENASSAFIAVFQVKRAAQIKMLYNFSKLAAAIALVLGFKQPDLLVWSVLYCLSSLFPAIVGLAVVQASIGKPALNLLQFKSELSQGLLFAVDLSATNISSNVDKALLGNLAGLEIAGIYGAGYRFIDICYYVIFALSGATYARFFKPGAAGIQASFAFAKKLLPIAFIYGLITFASLFWLAPIAVPLMLGQDYRDSVEVLQWLAAIHLTSYVQLLGADILTGAGFQGYRSGIGVTAALLNAGLNLWLIPIFSWKGAACVTIATEALKTLGFWLTIAVLHRQRDFKQSE